MAKNNKPRNKAYRPDASRGTIKLRFRPWRVDAVCSPVLAIIDQLEQSGTIDEISGQPVFKDIRSGKWCDSVAGLEGVVDMYGINEIRTGCCLDLAPITVLANKLKYDMPISAYDTSAARAALDRIRKSALAMTEKYAIQLLNDFRLKLHIAAEVGVPA